MKTHGSTPDQCRLQAKADGVVTNRRERLAISQGSKLEDLDPASFEWIQIK